MKKVSFILTGLLFLILSSTSILRADDKADIELVIKASYFNGAFNGLDTESMRKGFHPDFAIFSASGNKLSRYPIDTWIKNIEERKQAANFDPKSQRMDCKIASLDITGGSAAAKIELSRDGKMVYTDYLSLLKFEDGWKIAAKVYFAHPKND
ncbi:MAG: nuclear transport factor 2 family protein [Candidatus Aminicenantes bacterium]|nr:nuclear transport factor 2 family protein [Candidatus Aminicenantes bacterium]